MGKTWSNIDCSNWSNFNNFWSDEWCENLTTNTIVQIVGAPPGSLGTGQGMEIRRNISECEMMFDPYIQSILEDIEYKRKKGWLTPMEESILNGEIASRMHYMSINY